MGVSWVRAAADVMDALRMAEAGPVRDIRAEAVHTSALARAHRRRLQAAERARFPCAASRPTSARRVEGNVKERFPCDDKCDIDYGLVAPPTIERAATQPPRSRPRPPPAVRCETAVVGRSRRWLLPYIAPVVVAAES